MARPIKSGIDYFPLDVALDNNVRLVEAKFGATGFAVIIKLWQRIYAENGYYCCWSEDDSLLFSRENFFDNNTVSEIVDECLKRGIFDKNMFENHGILTSKGVQKRFVEATARRKEVYTKEEYLLIEIEPEEVNVNNNPVNVNINEENADNNTQSKEKKSKVNKSKLNEIKEEQTKAISACSDAPAPIAQEASPVVAQMILNDKSIHQVSEADVKHYKELYPNADVESELRKMQGWLESNPTKRKTASGVERFINAWLAKAQDTRRANSSQSQAQQSPAYDVNEFMKRAVGLKYISPSG